MKYEGSRDVNEAYTQWREFRRVPVPRLVNKIGISRYMELPTNDLGALSPAEVRIPLRQHIGAPAQAVVKAGDRVKCGDVIGEIPEQGLGARIHASMDGVVKSVDGASSSASSRNTIRKGAASRPLTKKERPCV